MYLFQVRGDLPVSAKTETAETTQACGNVSADYRREAVMSEPAKSTSFLGDAIRDELAAIVKDAVADALKAKNGVEERLLDIDEAAKIMSVTTDWLYHNRKKLPFTRKLGHKMLRFSYVGLLRWMDSKKFGS
jgi:predicted DNA-binding transcriptional regulator AlpA